MDRNNNLIYFNNNRTTFLDEEVKHAMLLYLQDLSQTDEAVLKTAREHLANFLSAESDEVVFTSGTTESVNLIMYGAFSFFQKKGNHIITTLTEHPVVLDCCRALEKMGAEVTYLGVDREGLIDISDLRAAIKPTTILVSIMAANNETGVIQPIEKISEICRDNSILFFCDASQYVGKIRCDVKDLGMDALAFGAHKMYGPENIGVLYVDNRFKELRDFILKDFTPKPSLSEIVGFAKAAQLSSETQWEMSAHISKLKNYLEHQLLDIEDFRINGSTRYRLYNTSNLTFPNGEKIMHLTNQFDFLHNRNRNSHVLEAMGLNDTEIKNSFRFSFGKQNTLEEVKLLVEEILKITSHLSETKPNK